MRLLVCQTVWQNKTLDARHDVAIMTDAQTLEVFMKTSKLVITLALLHSVLAVQQTLAQCDVAQQVQTISFPGQVWRDVALSFRKLVTPTKKPLRDVHNSVDRLLEAKEIYWRKLVRYSKGDPTMDWTTLKHETSQLVTEVALGITELERSGDLIPEFRDDGSYKKLHRNLDAKRLQLLCSIDQSSVPLTTERAVALSKEIRDEIDEINKADDELIKLLKNP